MEALCGWENSYSGREDEQFLYSFPSTFLDVKIRDIIDDALQSPHKSCYFRIDRIDNRSKILKPFYVIEIVDRLAKLRTAININF